MTFTRSVAYLTQLSIENFRIIQQVQLTPSARLNFILGANASGKSSLLEGIHFLGRARSFREQNWREVRRQEAQQLRVTGRVATSTTAPPSRLGVERNDQELRIRVNGQTAESAKELLERLPLLLVEPESHRLIEQGPAYRRRFLDWGVFHVEPHFFPAWQRYRKAWRQRNALLRMGGRPMELDPWEQEMGSLAETLDRQRRDYVEQLLPILLEFGRTLLDIEELSVRYQRGWPQGETLEEVLQRARPSDQAVGYTRHGPQRADLALYIEEHRAAARVSRGQQKLLVFCLVLAQAQLLSTSASDKQPVLLVDDLAAELDRNHVSRLVHLLQSTGMQVFITGTEATRFPLAELGGHAVFHVEHGTVSAVV